MILLNRQNGGRNPPFSDASYRSFHHLGKVGKARRRLTNGLAAHRQLCMSWQTRTYAIALAEKKHEKMKREIMFIDTLV